MMTILKFEPLGLSLEGIGPFQEKPVRFDFTDPNNDPCNFYLLISENGKGKTTVLEIMTVLMDMLNNKEPEIFGHKDLDRLEGGRAQLDILFKVLKNGLKETVILSLIAGPSEGYILNTWTEKGIEGIGAMSWHPFGYRRNSTGRLERIGRKDDLVNDLVSLIHQEIIYGKKSTGFEESILTLPIVIYFSAYRDILPLKNSSRSITEPDAWQYKPVYRFTSEGDVWTRSLDNLLVWLSWLDDGRFEKAVEIINSRVFKRSQKFISKIRKSPPEAVIKNGDQEHTIDRLSSGEKSLIQLFLRIGTHMTQNTILLIDEMDVHLHLKWQHRLLNILKDMAKDNPGLTIISTTHSREVLTGFSFETEENGLRKGGHIIDANL
ncbi:MAG: AAA family ATPase [Desulfobacteraceae bacterium]|jgi:energy-coupling factor transporter ATP-binding protein EcfA2|nr:AAA family ATPase [Desulfobacteraceae bacterium]